MKATETTMLNFLKKADQFEVPIYQRTYDWTESECRQLWNDILRAGSDDKISAHFLGSIVCIEKKLAPITTLEPMSVIDGQQRLATMLLIIESLARQLGETVPVDGFSAKKLRTYYLLNTPEEGESRYKLLLTQTDKQTLLAILDQKSLPAEPSLRLKENLEFFEQQIKKLNPDFKALCKGLAKLMIVEISIDRDHDNPQLIFESMNSTGLDLSQADLIRNFILMGLESKHQKRLYNDHWRPMEIAFGQEAYGQHFDSFMRHYLTVKMREIPKIREVYKAFKVYAHSMDSEIDALVADIHTYAGHYCAMALGKETNSVLSRAFADLRELKVDVAYPLLLEIYNDYHAEILSAEDLEKAVRLIEGYVFRRAVCNIPTNSMNKTFGSFGTALKKDNYLESIQAHFLLLPSYRRFPSDEEFYRDIQTRDLYNFRSRSYWLRRLENYNRKERVPVGAYTIEHILPQNENLSKEWQESLGDDWREIQSKYLHTLGNLTLTGYNPELSDRPFIEKRDDPNRGFGRSPLHVNEGLKDVNIWNQAEIEKRARSLAKKATLAWTMPDLPAEVLDKYDAKPSDPQSGYAIEDYKYLAESGSVRQLFDAFRKEVLNLDPCVTEEFFKTYVAYKAETNFVDVIPQSDKLLLSLNLQFHELHDPQSMAKDVTNLGHRGNGDVEVILGESEELPYVMGLVRQSLEKQMGDE